MKNISILSILLILKSFLQIYSIEQMNDLNKLIPNININSTAFSPVIEYGNGVYQYFSFDYDAFSKMPLKDKKYAYFLITTTQKFFINSNLSKSITHSFIDKDAKNITFLDILKKENNVTWHRSRLIYKSITRNSVNLTNYYIGINRENAEKNKKALIIKIPIPNKIGFVKIQHVCKLPDMIQKIMKAPYENIVEDLITQTKKINNTSVNNKKNTSKNQISYKNKYNNKYINNNNYNITRRNNHYKKGKCAMRFIFGGILASLWSALIVLYFMVNRRKKTFSVMASNIGNNNVGYMNI